MKHLWLNKKDNKNLILFFNGWAMNETAVNHLDCSNYDILMVSDYRKIDFSFCDFDFSKYEKKYLIAWSMGVYVSNLFKKELLGFDKKIAINGTNKIIDDDFGIPKKVYKVTVKYLNEESKDKFILNMFKGGLNKKRLNPNIKIDRPLEELKEELTEIQRVKINETLDFDKIIISKDDRIVPTKNQINFWQGLNKNYELINSTHCPFEIYSSWTDLIC